MVVVETITNYYTTFKGPRSEVKQKLDRQPLTVDLTTESYQEKGLSTPSAVSSDSSTNPSPALVTQVATEGEPQSTTERSHTMMALKASEAPNFVTLRTVRVILKSGNRRVEVNALLDDASTKTYLTSDVAAELALQGNFQKETVNAVNGRTETFETMPVEFEIESLDDNFMRRISAFTTDRFTTGNVPIINWAKESGKWKHLQGIQFPQQSTARPIVDILFGVACLDLHFSHEDVQGLPGEPIARRTPLGCTCIGNPEGNQGRCVQTSFIHAYFAHEESKLGEIDSSLREFWEVEAVKKSGPVFGIEDRVAMKKVEKSLKFVDSHYQVGIPWKENSLRRLQNTEQRVFKKPDIARVYSDCIELYISKGYICKVPVTEEQHSTKWFLPHFPIVKPDRTTTKTLIVFNASAKYQGVSLNDAIFQEPKLQHDLFHVLLRFRKNSCCFGL